jgi:hypothetical protein
MTYDNWKATEPDREPAPGEHRPYDEACNCDGCNEMPRMTCPKCGEEMADFDGFGVLAHVAPMKNACGYCSHPTLDGDACGICGATIVRDPGPEPAPGPTTPPMREVHRIIEVTGERGGTHVVHVLECGHWLTRRKAATKMRCIGCVIEGHVNDHRLNVDEAATYVMGALRAVERGMQDAQRAELEDALRLNLEQMKIDRVDRMIEQRNGRTP